MGVTALLYYHTSRTFTPEHDGFMALQRVRENPGERPVTEEHTLRRWAHGSAKGP